MSANAYQYVVNNPVNFVDPSGAEEGYLVGTTLEYGDLSPRVTFDQIVNDYRIKFGANPKSAQLQLEYLKAQAELVRKEFQLVAERFPLGRDADLLAQQGKTLENAIRTLTPEAESAVANAAADAAAADALAASRKAETGAVRIVNRPDATGVVAKPGTPVAGSAAAPAAPCNSAAVVAKVPRLSVPVPPSPGQKVLVKLGQAAGAVRRGAVTVGRNGLQFLRKIGLPLTIGLGVRAIAKAAPADKIRVAGQEVGGAIGGSLGGLLGGLPGALIGVGIGRYVGGKLAPLYLPPIPSLRRPDPIVSNSGREIFTLDRSPLTSGDR